jgi:hypothetical protein
MNLIEENKDVAMAFEDISEYPIFNKPQGAKYNPDLNVMVRVICDKCFPFDFST